MGRRMNLKMMAFLKASMLGVYGTRMIAIFCPPRKVFYLPDTRWGQNWQVV